MGKDLRALRVLQTAKLLRKTPVWIHALREIPSPGAMNRTLPINHNDSQPNRKRVKTGKSVYVPQRIRYEEDGLRKTFFQDHPWELARPRLVIEEDGKDWRKWDWSLADQPGRPINGESAIQRQRWLMQDRLRTLTKRILAQMPQATQEERHRALDRAHEQIRDEAYEQARKEFYQQRREMEAEVRIAQEEAQAVGAQFGPDMNTIGMHVEGLMFDKWKAWAEREAEMATQLRGASFVGGGEGDHGAIDDAAGAEDVQAVGTEESVR